MMVPIHHPLVFVFGLLGNMISFMVYLAPVPTFWRIFNKKSTEGFSTLPYVCALFSSMLWIYYALLKTNSLLLITINSFGCVIETLYIALFLTYAPKEAKMAASKLLLLLNLFGFSAIILVCNYLAKASIRVELLGWICVAFAVVVFAAPLSVIRTVIRTKSVEFMPLPLSLCLTISAVMWFMYGLLQTDLYIVLPNVGGFTFGVAQMILYGVYRKNGEANKKDIEMRLPEKMPTETPVKVENGCKAEIQRVIRVNDDELGAVVVVDMEREEKKDENEVEVEPREMHVQGLSPCGVDEIKLAGPMATTPIQVVDCVY